MDTWFINALIMTGTLGGFMLLNKVIIEKKYNEAMSFMSFYVFVFTLLTSLFLIYSDFSQITYTSAFFGVMWGILDYTNFRTRIISLRYIPAATYFITARLSSSLLLLLLGVIYFGDVISPKEYIGFFIGFVVFSLLFERQKMKEVNYKKGIIYLVISSFILVGLHFTNKQVTNIEGIDAYTFLFIFGITALVLSISTQYREINFKVEKFKQILVINFIQAILLVIYFIFLLKTYSLGDLGISYKILSYSMFIPIIGSIVFFKEKITWRKILAFVLTIVSLWFFMN